MQTNLCRPTKNYRKLVKKMSQISDQKILEKDRNEVDLRFVEIPARASCFCEKNSPGDAK